MKTSASIIVLAISLTATSSIAADLATQKAPQEAPQANAMRGFYIGINGGYGGGDISSYSNILGVSYNSGTPTQSFIGFGNNGDRIGGALAGGQLGYNFIFRDRYLIGGEVDVDWANVTSQRSAGGTVVFNNYGSSVNSNGGNGGMGLRWVGTARARFGYQIGSLVPFISGGVAFGETSSWADNYNYTVSPAQVGVGYAHNSSVSAGWAAGAGVEYSVAKDWSLKTEYLYTQLSAPSPQIGTSNSSTYGNNYQSPTIMTQSSSPIGVHQVRFGVNYHPHLFEAAPVLVAKY